MSRDSALYPDAETFRPERFEGLDAEAMNTRDPRKYIFGFGRRYGSFKRALHVILTYYVVSALDVTSPIRASGS